MSLPRIAITLGDPAGIGPEIALKTAANTRLRELCIPLLIGDWAAVQAQRDAGVMLPELAVIHTLEEIGGAQGSAVEFWDLDHFRDQPLILGEVRAAHGRAAVDAAAAAIAAALAHRVDAVVAAPQTELAIKQAGIEFDGYPSFVARCTATAPEDVFLMLCFERTRIVHATLHQSLRRAIELISAPRLGKVFEATNRALRQMSIARPRIAVAGLNPHAGENGLFGNEEAAVIIPAIEAGRRMGLDLEGPFGADTLFQRPGYDGFVVMYHDQGHIAAKLLGHNRAAALTIGTPILFSSVAHGSALDIAGQNRADPRAMVEAVERLLGRTG
ncbi:MAG TPA: 4-hydroxythreonine-4-phosphate dehydrogenase PdxA [Candidatus Binataceae bacterium]|nr:4-hydroxythreonine-4-phosphate dehydrogenase PdxA [Candidatus Binataceae bacterium]